MNVRDAAAHAGFRGALRVAVVSVAVQAEPPVVPGEPDALIAAGAVIRAAVAVPDVPVAARASIRAGVGASDVIVEVRAGVGAPDVIVEARAVIQAGVGEPDAPVAVQAELPVVAAEPVERVQAQAVSRPEPAAGRARYALVAAGSQAQRAAARDASLPGCWDVRVQQAACGSELRPAVPRQAG